VRTERNPTRRATSRAHFQKLPVPGVNVVNGCARDVLRYVTRMRHERR
jgi:hypothetical protein